MTGDAQAPPVEPPPGALSSTIDTLLPGRRGDMAAAASGLVAAFIYPHAIGPPPFGWDTGLVACVVFVPFLLAVCTESRARAVRRGLLWGAVHYLAVTYWVEHVLTSFANMGHVLGMMVLLVMTAAQALFIAGAAWLLHRGYRAWGMRAVCLMAPVTWAAMDLLKQYMPFGGFPWEAPGYALFQWLPLVQLADITGVYGVTCLILLANAAVAAALVRRWQGEACLTRTFVVRLVACTLALWIANGAYGAWRLAAVERSMADAPRVNVAVLQGNIPQDQKWDSTFVQKIVRTYDRLTRQALNAQADFIIWPEAAVPFRLEGDPRGEALIAALQASSADYLLGALRIDLSDDGQRIEYFNSAYHITSNAREVPFYDKTLLVPFGEYVPLQSILFFVDKVTEGASGNLSRGDHMVVFDGAHGQRYATLICYEVIFPRLARAAALQDANLLTTITNDAWFGQTSAPAQHLGMAVLRSIETHKALARAANTGYSAFVAPTGEVWEATTLYEEDLRVRALPLMKDQTFYVRYGDVFAYACALAVFATAFFSRRPGADARG